MNRLCEAMDLLQENIRRVAEKFEKAEERPEYDPPYAPTGEVSGKAPMTPGFVPGGVSVPPPPPPAIPAAGSGTPLKPDYTPPTLPLARFAGFSPARLGEAPMTRALPLTVSGMKQACHMQDEATGKIFSASPTARHNPSTGTAAFAPLGYIQMLESGEFRRV